MGKRIFVITSIDFKAVSKKGQHLNICYQERSDEIRIH